MKGIFYDRATRRLYSVNGMPDPDWTLISHNLEATFNQCRRVLRELLTMEELANVDWSALRHDRAA